MKIRVIIPLKLPSLNEYTNECRKNRYAGASMKRKVQDDLSVYLYKLPKMKKVKIDFTWIEGNKRRDLDNVCFAKKFILDTLVELGKLQDDNRKNVCGFSDNFCYGDNFGVIVDITYKGDRR